MESPVIISLISLIGIIGVAIIAYIKDVRLKKLQIEIDNHRHNESSAVHRLKETTLKMGVLDRLLDFETFNKIKNSVDRMFETTKADRFMILIAMNGKTDFRVISVIFEQHKTTKWKVNAIVRYRDIEIDDRFKSLLKEIEHEKCVNLVVSDMKPQLLRDLWTLEKIKHSKLRFLHRQHLDDSNDIIIYSSLATHSEDPFTKLEDAFIKTEYEGSIIKAIREYV